MAKKKSRTAARKPVKATKKPLAKKQTARKTAKPAKAAAKAAVNVKAHAIASMQFAHDFVVRACMTMPEDKQAYQATANDNHALWTMGHIATAYDWFAGLLDGGSSQLSENDQKLFGFQSKPVGDASVYPGMAAIKAMSDKAWERLLSAAQKTKDSDLGKAPLADSMGFAPDRLTVLERTCWHDGWHAGQVSTIRRALGLPSLMGG